ncbi:hypothetical protein [Deinococcus ruber]|uniref:hypothetical protein n=1 Tax=Deinococcus ruber TaxID=1848197 RepID=UPI00166C44B1|nr:hypothetical protein [Deinococcus ruber]
MSSLLAAAKHTPRSVFVVLFFLLLTILGSLWLETKTPPSQELKDIGNPPLEVDLPLPHSVREVKGR